MAAVFEVSLPDPVPPPDPVSLPDPVSGLPEPVFLATAMAAETVAAGELDNAAISKRVVARLGALDGLPVTGALDGLAVGLGERDGLVDCIDPNRLPLDLRNTSTNRLLLDAGFDSDTVFDSVTGFDCNI